MDDIPIAIDMGPIKINPGPVDKPKLIESLHRVVAANPPRAQELTAKAEITKENVRTFLIASELATKLTELNPTGLTERTFQELSLVSNISDSTLRRAWFATQTENQGPRFGIQEPYLKGEATFMRNVRVLESEIDKGLKETEAIPRTVVDINFQQESAAILKARKKMQDLLKVETTEATYVGTGQSVNAVQ